jgi:hypothetical protein
VLGVDEHDQLECGAPAGVDSQRAIEEGRVGDDDARACVADDVLALLGGERRVDGERRGAQQQRGGVGDVELGPVRHPQRDGVAAADAQPRKPGRGRSDPVGVLAPGPARRAVGALERRRFGVCGHGGGERVAQSGNSWDRGHGRQRRDRGPSRRCARAPNLAFAFGPVPQQRDASAKRSRRSGDARSPRPAADFAL